MSDCDHSVYGETKLKPLPDEWSNRPHTLSLGLITLVYIVYAAFKERDEEYDSATNLKRGIKYAIIFFLVYCAAQLRDGHFVRPHPIVWRVVTGLFIVYEMFLIVLLFQNQQDAPRLLKHLDPTLGVQLPPRSYGESCTLYTPDDPVSAFRNLTDTVFDIFVLMHFFGWFIGALMIRDHLICWSISILFELYELTFSHWLPNFKECWWDHIFLDVFMCNAAGIYLGMKMCHWFEMKSYNWVGIQTIPHLSGKAKRAMEQFTPFDWLPYDWKMFRSQSRFWSVLFMIFSLSVMMLNSFFLKTVLWVPASNPLNVIRLSIWYSAGSYAIAEYYLFCAAPGARKLGPRAWLGLGVVVTEVLIIFKFGKGYFVAPFPFIVKISWGIAFFVLVVGSTIYFQCLKTEKQVETSAALLVTSPGGTRHKLTTREPHAIRTTGSLRHRPKKT